MACSYTNNRNQTYFLHQKGRLYYFSKEEKGAIEKPAGYTIVENKKTGLPMLKKE
jgi:hypothetical protein